MENLGRGVRLELQGKSVIKNMVAAGHNRTHGSNKGMGTLAAWAAKGFSESTRAVDVASRRVSSDPPSLLPRSHPSLCATEQHHAAH